MKLARAIERGRELAQRGGRLIFVYLHSADYFWIWYKRGRLTAICTPSGNVKMGKDIPPVKMKGRDKGGKR